MALILKRKSHGGCKCPVAVPGVCLGDRAPALHTDRCHSLASFLPPPAAVSSLPTGLLHLDGFESVSKQK